jgi:hypothetical protein
MHGKRCQAVAAQDIQLGRHGVGPWQHAEQRDQRRKIAGSQRLPQLNPGIAAPAVPAAAPRYPRQGQLAVGQLDYCYTITRVTRRSGPGRYQQPGLLAEPRHQKLQIAANPEDGAPLIVGVEGTMPPGPLNRPFDGQLPSRSRKPVGSDHRCHVLSHRPYRKQRLRVIGVGRLLGHDDA